MPSITGGTGTRPISARVKVGAIQRRSRHCRSLHGGGPSHSSPMMPFEWPDIRVGRPLGGGGGLRAHAQGRRTVPSCSDGVKSPDSIVRQSAPHALGQLQAKEAVMILNPWTYTKTSIFCILLRNILKASFMHFHSLSDGHCLWLL